MASEVVEPVFEVEELDLLQDELPGAYPSAAFLDAWRERLNRHRERLEQSERRYAQALAGSLATGRLVERPDEPIESLPAQFNLWNRYRSQATINLQVGNLEVLNSGKYIGQPGYRATFFDEAKQRPVTKTFPLPDYQDLKAAVPPDHWETVEKKIDAGLTQFLIVPVFQELEALQLGLMDALLTAYDNHELCDSDGNPSELNMFVPVRVRDVVRDAGLYGEFAYMPRAYTIQRYDPASMYRRNELRKLYPSGYQFLLIEPVLRPGIKATGVFSPPGQTAEEYLANLQHTGEQGITLEAWYVQATTEIEKRISAKDSKWQKAAMVIDDWQGGFQKGCLCTGSYMPGQRRVVAACWLRDSNQYSIQEMHTGRPYADFSSRRMFDLLPLETKVKVAKSTT